MSPGWQSNALQIASNVEKRIAFAFPFFKIERLAIVMPTLSVSSVTLIFLFANITSMLIIVAIIALRPLNHFLILCRQYFEKAFERHRRLWQSHQMLMPYKCQALSDLLYHHHAQRNGGKALLMQ